MAAAPDAAADELSAEEGTAQAADPAGEPAVNRRRENLARQRSANTTVARARNRELRERMLERFSLGEQTFDQLRAAFPEAGWHRIKNAVTKLLGAGHLERARYGVYRLASRDAATTVAPADGTPHADVRDRLLRGADLVLEGKLSKDGAEALVELVDAILAIDLGAPT